MDEYELIKQKTLRGELNVAVALELARQLSLVAKLVKRLDTARTLFRGLKNTSTRLERRRDFASYCLDEKSRSWEEISKLKRDALLFLSTCFTANQLKDVDFKASELEDYVEAHPELKDTETQKVVKHRLEYQLALRRGEAPAERIRHLQGRPKLAT